jgi:hypothetical protein
MSASLGNTFPYIRMGHIYLVESAPCDHHHVTPALNPKLSLPGGERALSDVKLAYSLTVTTIKAFLKLQEKVKVYEG